LPQQRRCVTLRIDAENYITVHASRKAAKETGSPVFSNEVQFADAIGPDNQRLLKIWNRLPGVMAVTRFANRKAASEQIWNAIQEMGGPAAAKPGPEPDLGATQATTSRVEVLAAEPATETTPPPIAQDTAPQAASLPVAVSVEGQPGAAPQASATVSAQAPAVAPPSAKASRKATRTLKPAQAPTSAKAANSDGIRKGSKTAQRERFILPSGGFSRTPDFQDFSSGLRRKNVLIIVKSGRPPSRCAMRCGIRAG
jgi:hypothetical protein